MSNGMNRVVRAGVRIGGAVAVLGSAAWFAVGAVGAVAPTSAFAASPMYELYCPGTPVGNVVLNNAVTSGTITPAAPTTGGTFNLTGYQTVVNVPAGLVSASAALGNTNLAGTANTTVNATGATPASISPPSISFSPPIPMPVPTAGLTLDLPTPAGTVGPFTATGGAISITEASSAKLSLEVSGNALALTCTSFTNNAAPEGITTSMPPASAATSPVIATATAGAGGGTTTPTTAATVTTPTSPPATVAPATAPTSGLATTGAGPGLYFLGLLGIALLVCASALLFFEKSKRMALRVLHRTGSSPPR